MNLELIEQSIPEIGNKQLPNSRTRQLAHLVNAAVPPVEVADDAHTRRMRRPNSKRDAFHAADLRHVRAELVVDLLVLAFGEKMKVQLAEGWWKTVRIANGANLVASMDP